MSPVRFWPEAPFAGVAHLVERHLAKVEVASSSLVGRSNTKPSLMQKCKSDGFFVFVWQWSKMFSACKSKEPLYNTMHSGSSYNINIALPHSVLHHHGDVRRCAVVLYLYCKKSRCASCCTAALCFCKRRTFSTIATQKQKSHRFCISASTMASYWSGRRGSNSLPPPWQGGALPDELRPQMVPQARIELATRGFSVRCSTN